ncbi:hypothetical protein PQR33_30525 [Paraburkholderia sediminicola]|uniref:hypothetical protein n=1 Tax=Paraburkholderia sediminicola TaxID=458836 RepID=UPI0038B6F45B
MSVITLTGGEATIHLLANTSSKAFAYAAGYWIRDRKIHLTLETKEGDNTERVVDLGDDYELLQKLKAVVDAKSGRDGRLAEDKFSTIRSYDDISKVASHLEQPNGGFLLGFDEWDKWRREINQRMA